MTTKIKKIEINALRGIPNLELDLDSKCLIIRGDNGTGKSSLVDGIEFFFSGVVSHLEGVQGMSSRKHGPHISSRPESVCVSMTFDPGNVILKRTFNDAPEMPAQLWKYFAAALGGKFILRRAELLEFIGSQPAERFRAIANIIGVSELDNYELTLLRARDTFQGKVESQKAIWNEARKTLHELLGVEVDNETDIIAAINNILSKEKLPPIGSLDEVQEHSEKMLASIKITKSVQRSNILSELSSVTAPVKLVETESFKKSNSANSLIKKLASERARKEREIAGLLDMGRKIIVKWDMSECPLCEQPINKDEVVAKVYERLKTVEQLSRDASSVRTICDALIDILTQIHDFLTATIKKCQEIPELNGETSQLRTIKGSWEKEIQQIRLAKEIEGEIPTVRLHSLFEQTKITLNSVKLKSTQLFVGEKVTEAEKNVLLCVGMIRTAKERSDNLRKSYEEFVNNTQYHKTAAKLFSTFSDVKKDRIQEVFTIIQTEMNRYYSMLHPGEPHGDIELKLQSTRRASIELQMRSFGRTEDPRALSSEGHLDSLGLCIFLAFVKKFNADCSLMVLDDVVTTIDAGHRENICHLLQSEFVDKQMIITTHDAVWYEQLRAYARAHGTAGYFKFITFTRWDVHAGPVITPYKDRWTRIQERILAGDTNVANEGRIYLEWVLSLICEGCKAQVPYKGTEPNYEIGELLPSAKSRIQVLLVDKSYKDEITKAFEDLESTIIYGNILSHNNPLATSVTIGEVEMFCGAVHTLHGKFLCPQCGAPVRYFHELKIMRCSNTNCPTPFECKTK
jgi:hypothetical protein